MIFSYPVPVSFDRESNLLRMLDQTKLPNDAVTLEFTLLSRYGKLFVCCGGPERTCNRNNRGLRFA